MSYTNLTKTELVFIDEYHNFDLSGRKNAKKSERGHEVFITFSVVKPRTKSH